MHAFVRGLTTSARLVSRRNAPPPTVYVDTGLVVAAVGRPNVGKSTLFNALAANVRGRGAGGADNPTSFVFVKSVVDGTPGVTRDARATSASVGDLLFTMVDTPGLERAVRTGESGRLRCVDGPVPSLVSAGALCDDVFYRNMYEAMERKTANAMRDADIAMLVLDAGDGVTPLDCSIAQWVRSLGMDTLVVANKCDKSLAEQGCIEAFELGLGEPIALSGEHKLGFADLYNYLNNAYQLKAARGVDTKSRKHWSMDMQTVKKAAAVEEVEEENPFDDDLVVGLTKQKGEEPLTNLIVSIVGRPNVGKSTLLNRLVGDDVSLVGPASGVTRDAVLCRWDPKTRNAIRADIPVSLIDTAGMRARARVEDVPLEQLSVRSSIRALRHSHVVLLVLDATESLTTQDVKLVDLAVAEGRAIVLVANKIDRIKDRKEWRALLDTDVRNKLHSIPGVEVVELSASEWDLGDVYSGKLFGAVHRARSRWEKRVSTSALNRFLRDFNERAYVTGSAQAKRNRRGVAKFMSQKKIRPPLFRIDGASAVSQNYLKQLTNELRRQFGYHGVPIRLRRPMRKRK